MNREDILRMAQEAWGESHEIFWFDDDGIERFATLVAAAEREACAKICESMEYDGYPSIEQQQCAATIRARMENK